MRMRATITTLTALASAAAATSALADQAPNMPQGSVPQHTVLQAMPHRTASFSQGMDGNLHVRFKLFGLTPASTHSVDIQSGTCPSTFRIGAGAVGALQANAQGQIGQSIDASQARRCTCSRPAC